MIVEGQSIYSCSPDFKPLICTCLLLTHKLKSKRVDRDTVLTIAAISGGFIDDWRVKNIANTGLTVKTRNVLVNF